MLHGTWVELHCQVPFSWNFTLFAKSGKLMLRSITNMNEDLR